MWISKPTILDANTHKIELFEGKSQISYQDVIHYWQENSEFRDFYFSILQESSFEAFFGKIHPLQRRILDRLMSLF